MDAWKADMDAFKADIHDFKFDLHLEFDQSPKPGAGPMPGPK